MTLIDCGKDVKRIVELSPERQVATLVALLLRGRGQELIDFMLKCRRRPLDGQNGNEIEVEKGQNKKEKPENENTRSSKREVDALVAIWLDLVDQNLAEVSDRLNGFIVEQPGSRSAPAAIVLPKLYWHAAPGKTPFLDRTFDIDPRTRP
eukprot:GHVU01219050.1.p1 GENE.GHVU01219050.1~~GHVU01219050.1.p1  ORF type:complete len:150 (+),score=12.37 GHVU01219050.1:1354-1803(+)